MKAQSSRRRFSTPLIADSLCSEGIVTTLSAEQLFGPGGVVYPQILPPIIAEGVGTPYPIMDVGAFEQLPLRDMSRVYWQEMLYRAHWAAISNSIRHTRWINACLAHSVVEPNFPAFCAALRGMTEAAADTSHSLGRVPETLAACSSHVIDALHGTSSSLATSQELEDQLIHFQFARKLAKGEAAPDTHKAKSAAKYIEAINHDRYPVRDLYSELCQVVHPAAQSLHWLTRMNNGGWVVGEPDDGEVILALCTRHKDSIEWIQQNSVNTTIFILQVLNAFPLSAVHTKSTRDIDMQSINLYNKIKGAFLRSNVEWPAV